MRFIVTNITYINDSSVPSNYPRRMAVCAPSLEALVGAVERQAACLAQDGRAAKDLVSFCSERQL